MAPPTTEPGLQAANRNTSSERVHLGLWQLIVLRDETIASYGAGLPERRHARQVWVAMDRQVALHHL
jgi:hypothetical protein